MNPQYPGQQPIARPEVFEVANMSDAMRIILTPEMGTTTEERWQKETPYLVENSAKFLGLGPQSCVLDYGCGIGRISKGLIEKCGCTVMGVDFSESMRLLAPEYVLSERFNVWSTAVFTKMVEKGFRVDAAVCLWVIQHVVNPPEVMQLISRALRPGGKFYTLNQQTRCVPTNMGWVNDGYDVWDGLKKTFQEEDRHLLPANVTTPQLASACMIQVLRKPAN